MTDRDRIQIALDAAERRTDSATRAENNPDTPPDEVPFYRGYRRAAEDMRDVLRQLMELPMPRKPAKPTAKSPQAAAKAASKAKAGPGTKGKPSRVVPQRDGLAKYAKSIKVL